MNKCLITKLASVVDDDNLRGLGEFRFTISDYDTTSSEAFYIKRTDDVDFNIIALRGNFINSDGFDVGTILQVPVVDKQIRAASGSILSIPCKYTITSFRFGESSTPGCIFDLNECKDMLELTELTLSSKGLVYGNLSSLRSSSKLSNLNIKNQYNIQGDMSDLTVFSQLKTLNISGTNLKGSLLSISNIPITNLDISNASIDVDMSMLNESLTRLKAYDSKLIGDIAELSRLSSLNYIDCTRTKIYGSINNITLPPNIGTLNIISCSNVYGELETLLANQIGLFSENKSFKLYAKGTNITYEGSTINTGLQITFTASSYTVTTI